MIKSYLLNNLFVPLRQISPSMLLASAALHSLLFAVPIPSNSQNTELSKGGNTPENDTAKVSKDVCDEDGSLEGAGEDSLDEDTSLEGAGEDPLGEDGSLEGAGEDSLGEDGSLEGAGEDSLGEDTSLEGAGEDSLGEDASLEGAGEDSLGEDTSLEGAGEDSLGEDESFAEEILGDENTATSSQEELCEDDTLPKGKAIKVPQETPLLSDLENESNSEEAGDSEDAIPDLANGEPLDESGDSIDDAPVDNISLGGDDISSEELPTPGENLSLGEPEIEPEIAFTPSEPSEEPIEDTPSESVEEPIDDISSEPVEEPIDDTSSETVEEPIDDTNSEPTEQPEEIAEPESSDTETELNPEETTPSQTDTQTRRVDPFAEFPKYSSVRPNFCGVKSAKIDRRTRLTSDSLDSVQAYFDKKLAGTDFQVEKLTDQTDTKVYQVSKGSLTQFLQLFAVEGQGTMILLSSQRVDCYRLSNESQLEETKTEEQAFDAAFQNLYAQLSWTEEKGFVANSEVEKIFGKDTNKTPDELALLVKTKLESEGFAASQVSQENSGLLYEVKKGEFTKYISFLPTKEGKGAIILALKNSP
ncbi:hypothetical protein Riv7116_5499 [Rivularia sp. PCC 7116]|uniref:hypothetical protein n=1 Tax=Rivularia sp. PCC 7116 TaxID=373994 RepID=UPI00029EDAA8|nr:hypothetical protein [Rivularia sp. PCC 7116]AFY57870.1 hypothetical protein Riv7116_5499 [Rivularia sp. PCC 7116]